MSNQKSKFAKFISGKGFYAALAICVIGAGSAAWVAVDRTLNSIDEGNQQIIENEQQGNETFPDLEKADQAQSGVEIKEKSPEPAFSSPTPSSSSKPQSEQPVQSVKPNAVPKSQPSAYVLPVTGEIFGTYSNGELVKNPTLKEWRTHDGIDIKAPKGTVVKAACDGKVVAVSNDALMGFSIEILHPDGNTSVYCGLAKDVKVKKDDTIKLGQDLGVLGDIPAEISLEPHLHFAMKRDGKWINPMTAMGKMD